MNNSHQALQGDPTQPRDVYQPPTQKINGAASQAYFQHDFPQQNYRVYIGQPNATPPTPPKVQHSAPPPPPPPKPPRSGNVPNLETVTPHYSSYSMSDENLYMNGGLMMGHNITDGSAAFTNRSEINNVSTTAASLYNHQAGLVFFNVLRLNLKLNRLKLIATLVFNITI